MEDRAISVAPSTPVEYRSPGLPDRGPSLPVGAAGALAPLVATESPARRWTFLAVAIAVTGVFFLGIMTYWVPVHPGVDQNGYLFGGRQLAQTGTMKFAPADPVSGQVDPHQFVGRMWVGTDYGQDTERFYPKYPIGLPLLIAIALKIGGETWGPWLVHLINPVAMSLGVFATFLLLRTFCGSFLAVLGQLVFASSPVIMLLSVDANSHATAVFCVAWGFVGLIAWWKRAHPVVGFFGGLLLGYAVTIRYTEATLLLPIVLVIAFRLGLMQKWWRIPTTAGRLAWSWVRGRDEQRQTHADVLRALIYPARDWVGAAMLLLGWLIPVAGLLIYNLLAMSTPTGYDPTNESKPGASFNLDHALDNWETTLRHLAVNGLFFLFPIAVLGLAWMFAWRRKAAIVLAAWIVPCLAAYTLYYWAPDPQSSNDPRAPGNLGVNIGYLRFYATVLPALAICGIWALGHLTDLMVSQTRHWTTRLAAHAAVPMIVFLACAVHLHNNGRDMESTQYSKLVLQTNVEQVLETIPENSAIFYQDHGLFHHLQFARNYLLYDTQTFRRGFVDNLLRNVDPDDPQGLDPGRSQSMHDRLKDFDQKQLDERQRQAALACLESGRRVFVLEGPTMRRPPANKPPRQTNEVVRRLTAKSSDEQTSPLFADVVARWRYILVPKRVSEVRDEKLNTPRQRRNRMTPQRYEEPWLVYEITRKPPESLSPEMQAILDFEAEQKAKAEQAAADQKAKQQAAREAQQKAREEEQKRQREAQAAAQERQRKIREQDQLLKDLENKITQSQKALQKASTDVTTTEQQLAELKTQHTASNDAVRRATADRQTIEAELARQRQEQQRLTADLENRSKQLATVQKSFTETDQKLSAAKTEFDRLKAEAEKAKAEAEKAKAEADKAKAEADRLRAEAAKLKPAPPPATRPTTSPAP